MKFLNDIQLVSNFKYTSIYLLARKCHFHPPYFAARNEKKNPFQKSYYIQDFLLSHTIHSAK